MLLSDTLLAMSISWGVLAVGLQSWSDLRASQQSLQALEQMHTQQREVQRLLDRISLSAGATRVTTTPQGDVQWVSKNPPISGNEGARDDTLTWVVPREIDPRDCQGNQASSLDLISHQFKLSTKQELSLQGRLASGYSVPGPGRTGGGFASAVRRGLERRQQRPCASPLAMEKRRSGTRLA